MTGASRLFISLYTDEDVTDRLAQLLRQRGYEAKSALEAGTVGFTDEEQLVFAASRGWAVLTYNRRDFSALARHWQDAGREHAESSSPTNSAAARWESCCVRSVASST